MEAGMSLTLIHNRLAVTVLLYMLLLSLWGGWRYLRGDRIDGNFRGALVIAEILILFQGGLGVFLAIIGLSPDRASMHVLYGVVAALGLPIIYAFTKGDDSRRTLIVYAAILFCNAVLVFRLMATG
jgi:hypothetical protein